MTFMIGSTKDLVDFSDIEDSSLARVEVGIMLSGYVTCGGGWSRFLNRHCIGEVYKGNDGWSVMLFASSACPQRGVCAHGRCLLAGAPLRREAIARGVEMWDGWHECRPAPAIISRPGESS